MMERLKKELSWLLVVALVVSSLVVGIGQLQAEAVANVGTGLVRVIIQINKNDSDCGGDASKGTDSSFRLQFLNAGGTVISATPDNAIEGRPGYSSWGDPLENNQTTTYGSTAGAGGNVQFIAPSLGTMTVNNTITQVQLVNTYWADDWRFNAITFQYSYDGGTNWVTIASGGEWRITSSGAVGTWAITWFGSNVKTLAFNANGGSGGGTYEAIPGQTITQPAAATRTGYTFAGWSGVPARMPNANSTYYAAWNVNSYNLTFNAGGGTGGTGPTSTAYGAAISAPAVSRTGYTHTGWTPVVPATMPAANSTYTATWTLNTYTITWDANGGTGGTTTSVNHGATPTPPTVSKTGYTFAGWSPAIVAATGATTYTAQWNINSYTITWDANGGTGGTTTSVNYGVIPTPPTVSRTGYTLTGWSPTIVAATGAATYTAQWSIDSYTITWDANGGTGGTTTSVNHGVTPTPPTVSRTGYTFAGWSPAIVPATGATTYTAQWNINSYTITFNGNGGSTPSAITQNYGTTVTAPADPTRAGYTFTGWLPVCPTTMPAVNTTCVAQWTVNQKTISFDSNGGSAVASITDDFGAQVSAPPAPTKTGNTFDGWYLDAELANAVTWPYTITGDVTLYAKWTVNNYNITFNANGGTGGWGPTAMPYGAALVAPTVTRTGYSFKQWAPGVPSTVPAEDATYNAVWTINKYTVSFDSNGGSAVGSITQDYNTTVALPTAPTKAGNTFDGWYSDAALTTAVTWPYTLGATNVTFYAKWADNERTISFDSNGGSPVADITQDYGTAVTEPADPTREGYTFTGWSPAVPAVMPTTDLECVAQWTLNTYTITWDADGGTGGGTDNVDHGTVPTPIDAGTKTGYTFTSWSPSIVAATGAATYTAQWSVNSYDLTFDANNGTGGTGPTSTQYGTALTPPTVTREGYTFTGWDPELAATMPAADTTYTAQWSIDAFTISFDSAGGSAVADISQDYGTAVTQPADPTREGYTFDGWSPAVPTVMPAENFECVAQWTLNTYTITWDANGGTGGGTNSCDHGDTPTPVSAGTKVGYTFTGWDPTIVAATEAATYTAQWSASAVNITFDANGGTGGTGATSMQPGTALTAPTVTKDGYVFGGWLPTVPATVPETDMTYVAQWVQTAVNVTKTEDGMVVNIQGWTADSQYQIWTYQQVQSDDLLAGDAAVQANQWILSKAYTPGSAGDVQGDGSINFTIFEEFISPTENYLIAVRIADANNNFVAEIRDAYTPEDVGEVVITKIIVDNVVTTGYELREIKGGAEMFIEVIGNNVPSITYTATILSGATPMPLAMVGNELTWNISALDPGIYTVEFTATNGNTTATQLMTFELFATVAPGTGYGIINSMLLAPTGTGVNITPDFANGTFSFRLREPGRTPQFRSIEYAVPETVAHPITAPGIYHVYGYVTRAGLIGTEVGGIDDGMIRTLVIPRTGQGSGPVTMSFTANQALPDVPKHTPIVFTAQATGLPDTVEYSFWRYDATGYILIKDWSSDNTLNWTPARIGEYSLEARAKGVGAGSYEINRSLTVNITDADEAKADITNITLNTAQLTAAQARQPIMLKANATSLNGEDLLYKFYVYDEDMRNTQLKGYSVDQHCVWTPRKAGMTYTISVLVKNQTSFGKYDAIESFEVTVD